MAAKRRIGSCRAIVPPIRPGACGEKIFLADGRCRSIRQRIRLYDLAHTAKTSFSLTAGADLSGNVSDDQIAVLSQLKEMIANPPPAAPGTAPEAKPDAGERLKKLQSLFDQGLINKDEYVKKKKEIMDAL